nr:hypothetical protein [Ochrobactrum sp. Marseille-Q0166]
MRSFAVVCLALGVIFAILDGARSVGASAFVTKPLLDIWARAAPEILGDAEALVTHYISAGVWNGIIVSALEQPGWVVFGVLALLFYVAGHRREKRFLQFTAR